MYKHIYYVINALEENTAIVVIYSTHPNDIHVAKMHLNAYVIDGGYKHLMTVHAGMQDTIDIFA